jgi:hypothetical protein
LLLKYRPKKGFEIPVTSWLKGELNHLITADYFSQSYIVEQGLFNWPAVEKQLKKLQSNDVGNAPGTIWNLMVFQRWYIKYMHV